MVTYTLPTNATENVTGMYTLFKYINADVTGGWFFTMILFAIFVITFIVLKTYETSKAFAGASFLGMILSIIFRVLGFIDNKIMYLAILMVGISVVWLHIENSRGM